MPNVKSAEKRAKTNLKRRDRNRRDRSRLRTAIKRVRLVESPDSAREALAGAESLLDRLAGKGVVHRNAAARHKSRLHRHVAHMGEK
ncbi:MAG: 30S ribosomal protein S20 [Gemmatimonadota bacterium]